MTGKGCRSWNSLVIFGTLSLATLCSGLFFSHPAQAGDLSWSGLYRVEGLQIDNPELDNFKRNKAYILHHLVLQPKMVAADGVTIYGRFDILNNGTLGANSQLGQTFGQGPNDGSPSNARDTNVLAQHEVSDTLAITQLYAQWVHEFGSLVVGRTPMQFGLGITHNAGNGPFDHWFDTRDMVGYKIVSGNLFVFPMIAKMNEGVLNYEDDVNDYIVQLQYENPETDLALGIMAEWRTTTNAGTDSPASAVAGGAFGGAGATLTNAYKHRLINIFTSQRVGNMKIALEGALLSGKTGVRTAAGTEVEMNSYGVAGDISFKKPESKWDFGLRAGIASGDDPGTDDTYEGFIFDRNYDVAFLMFNHPLGQGDFLRTALNRNTSVTASSVVDEEAISNAVYVSPRAGYQLNERLAFGGSFTYGILDQDPFVGGNTSRDLGFELDLNVTYKPYERLSWVTEVGTLFPGEAWKGGTQNLDNKFAYGVTTKAAISF